MILSFISTVSPTVYTNPSQKRTFSKTLFKPEEFEDLWKADFALQRNKRNGILEIKLFENIDITIIKCFPCPSFPQTQI